LIAPPRGRDRFNPELDAWETLDTGKWANLNQATAFGVRVAV
jgi:hypothetical protein